MNENSLTKQEQIIKLITPSIATNFEVVATLDNYLERIEFSPNGDLFAICYRDGKLYIFDARTNQVLKEFNFYSAIWGVSISHDNKWLVAAVANGEMAIINLNDFSSSKISDRIEVTCVRFSNNSNIFYSSNSNGMLKEWNVVTKECLREKTIHDKYKILALDIRKDDQYILTGCNDQMSHLIRIEDFSVVQTFDERIQRSPNGIGEMKDVAFHPSNNNLVALAGMQRESNVDNGSIKIFDITTKKCIHHLIFNGYVYALEFFNDYFVLVLCGNGILYCINIQEGCIVQEIHCNCPAWDFDLKISVEKDFILCGMCNGNQLLRYNILSCNIYDEAQFSKLIELSKQTDIGGVISFINDQALVRKLIANGLCLAPEEYPVIENMCWDLVDLNETNGGNMWEFLEDQADEDADESEDD
eukprot:TRINITY_DN1418_c0_g1_i1.p1 TRINITY_DN1418_c0_g1~~TRINITY_DN1418_c0_g1_i1.p1  ORF type:complete len:416 (-),score=100.77 TRINITY_DN1418_c0_g1_i1:65-1312(-)